MLNKHKDLAIYSKNLESIKNPKDSKKNKHDQKTCKRKVFLFVVYELGNHEEHNKHSNP